jgi:DNA-binding MarR family transcriptional regulator
MIGEPDRLLARRRLGRMHHRVLYFVARSPGASVGELTRTLGVSKQALNAPLRRLVDQGLVAWTRSDADQRVKRLELSAEGRRLEARLSALQRAQFAAAFAAVGPAAERAWRRAMQAFAMAEMRKAGRWSDPGAA